MLNERKIDKYIDYGLKRINKCMKCGRTWNNNEQIKLSVVKEYIIKEIICEQCQNESKFLIGNYINRGNEDIFVSYSINTE